MTWVNFCIDLLNCYSMILWTFFLSLFLISVLESWRACVRTRSFWSTLCPPMPSSVYSTFRARKSSPCVTTRTLTIPTTLKRRSSLTFWITWHTKVTRHAVNSWSCWRKKRFRRISLSWRSSSHLIQVILHETYRFICVLETVVNESVLLLFSLQKLQSQSLKR